MVIMRSYAMHACLTFTLLFSVDPNKQALAADDAAPALIGIWEADIGEDEPCVMAFDSDQTVSLYSRGITGEGKYRVDATSASLKLDLYDMRVLDTNADRSSLSSVIVAIVEFPATNKMRFCSADVPKNAQDLESIRPTGFDGDVLDFVRQGAASQQGVDQTPTETVRIKKNPKPEVVLQGPPRRPLNKAPFQGVWQIDFIFQRNTAKWDETAHPWATFDCLFIQKGSAVIGDLKGADDEITGTINGTLTDTGLVGTMQLSQDTHDWQIFALRLIKAGIAEGTAVFAPRQTKDDERHIYLLKAKRKQSAAGQ